MKSQDVSALRNNDSKDVISKTTYKILFALLWVHYTAYLLLYRVFIRIPIVTLIADAIFPLLTILLVALSFPFFLKKCRATELFIYFGFVFLICISWIFSPERVSMAIENEWVRVIISTMPFVFIGACFDVEENEKLLFYMSVAGLVAQLLFQMYSLMFLEKVTEDNMASAYNALPAIAYLIYYTHHHSKLLNWALVVVSVVLLFSYGTRGAIVCIIVFSAGLLVYRISKMHSAAVKLFLIVLIALFLAICFFTDFIYQIMFWMSETFDSIGLSTRIFDLFLEESIADDSGRGSIAQKVLQGVSENAILGYGVMGDRNFVTTYSHNMLYELWCSFGVIFGTLLFVAAVMLPVYAIIKTKNSKEKLFIWMLMSITIVKLFMSSSYLYETNLFLMIGYSISVVARSKTAFVEK